MGSMTSATPTNFLWMAHSRPATFDDADSWICENFQLSTIRRRRNHILPMISYLLVSTPLNKNPAFTKTGLTYHGVSPVPSPRSCRLFQ